MEQAQDFSFDDLYVGMQGGGIEYKITAEMMAAFENLSGDRNPLHCDENYAREKNFPDRVVYGMLTAAMYSCLAGMHLPGKRCLLQSVHADFLQPVFIGDKLTVSGKIIDKIDSVRQVVIKADIRNQHGQKVSRAKIEAGVI